MKARVRSKGGNKVILVSKCLLGVPCRYDGKSVPSKVCEDGLKKLLFLPVCPEVLGGLDTPRSPAEIQKNGTIVSKAGQEVTKEFLLGAEKTLEIAKSEQIKVAILKSKSPSCGSCQVYSGDFDGKLIEGFGVTALLLKENNIIVYNEENAPFEKLKVYDFLDKHQIPYRIYQHSPVYTVEEAKAIETKIEGTHCKNLFLRNRKGNQHYLAILEQNEQVTLKDLAELVGEKSLSFASEERLQTYLGVKAGAVGLFGLLNDSNNEVKVILGKELAHQKEITFHPNENDETLGILYTDLEKILKILKKIDN